MKLNRTVKFDVIQEDIDNGIRANPTTCPLALALKRKTGNEWRVGTSSAHERKNLGGRTVYVWYLLTPKSSKFVRAFDNGKTRLQPFTDEIQNIDWRYY